MRAFMRADIEETQDERGERLKGDFSGKPRSCDPCISAEDVFSHRPPLRDGIGNNALTKKLVAVRPSRNSFSTDTFVSVELMTHILYLKTGLKAKKTAFPFTSLRPPVVYPPPPPQLPTTPP